jgi:hypothetical protein
VRQQGLQQERQQRLLQEWRARAPRLEQQEALQRVQQQLAPHVRLLQRP